MKKMSKSRRFAVAGAVAVAVAVGLVGTTAGVASASITPTGSTEFTKEVFRETIKPWGSVSLPPASCGEGAWLVKDNLALAASSPAVSRSTSPAGSVSA